ncbi:MAG: GNAT family N-acetyltransferase [Bacteroidota bacterium]
MHSTIRPIQAKDLPALKGILETIELFPPEMLDDMVSDYLNNPETQAIWFAAERNAELLSLAYCDQEMLTEGTFNLYAIGVRADLQGQGIGAQMMQYLEQYLQERKHRVLIVETSGSPELAATRKFYEKLGYTKEATIRDFWGKGDDKVIYWKSMES